MATQQEEKDEQAFFAGKVKEQEQERKHTMPTETKSEHKPPAKGFGGDQVKEGEGDAPNYIQNLPEGSVISPLGVTRPPEVTIIDPYRKTVSKDNQIAGKVLMKGKTHHGYCYERIVEITQPRTEKGMFQVFKAHFPDAVDEDFSVEALSDEDAEKLEKKWVDELRNKEKGDREKRAKEYEESTAKQQKEEKKNG